MTSEGFVPVDFQPPSSLVTDRFHLEPLGPQHNQADHRDQHVVPIDDPETVVKAIIQTLTTVAIS